VSSVDHVSQINTGQQGKDIRLDKGHGGFQSQQPKQDSHGNEVGQIPPSSRSHHRPGKPGNHLQQDMPGHHVRKQSDRQGNEGNRESQPFQGHHEWDHRERGSGWQQPSKDLSSMASESHPSFPDPDRSRPGHRDHQVRGHRIAIRNQPQEVPSQDKGEQGIDEGEKGLSCRPHGLGQHGQDPGLSPFPPSLPSVRDQTSVSVCQDHLASHNPSPRGRPHPS